MADLALPGYAARAVLPFVLPVCLRVARSDLARMKIPNRAVAALILIFALAAPLVLPLDLWARRCLRLIVVLFAGFALFPGKALGAGDATFVAAAALLVPLPDAVPLLALFTASLLTAFAIHRIARAIPEIRKGMPDRASWTAHKFPLGLALSLYVLIAAIKANSARRRAARPPARDATNGGPRGATPLD